MKAQTLFLMVRTHALPLIARSEHATSMLTIRDAMEMNHGTRSFQETSKVLTWRCHRSFLSSLGHPSLVTRSIRKSVGRMSGRFYTASHHCHHSLESSTTICEHRSDQTLHVHGMDGMRCG